MTRIANRWRHWNPSAAEAALIVLGPAFVLLFGLDVLLSALAPWS